MANPSPARRRVVALLALVPWPLVLFQLLFVLPRYDRLFREFGLKVSGLAQLSLDVSLWAHRHLLLAFLITFVLMGLSFGTATWVQSSAGSRGRRVLVLLVVFGVPCGLFVLAWVGVLGAHRTLVEGLDR